MLDHRVRENTGGEAEVSAEAHCRAQVQLKQFPHRQLPLLRSFLTVSHRFSLTTFQTGPGGLLYVVSASRPCKALLPESAA